MATVRKEFQVAVRAEQAWDAVRDFGALHKRLVPGFVTATHVEGNDRVVTFFTGTVLRERLVTLDDEQRRLVWSIVDGPYSHHNGAMQVFADKDGGCHLVWTTDLLPHEVATRTSELMEQGSKVIKQTLERAKPDAA
jgi:polyketide cyclase/dehydrase/lipid transport protein